MTKTKTASKVVTDATLSKAGESSKLAIQWAKGVASQNMGNATFEGKMGLAFEEMAKDRYNTFNPFNKITLCDPGQEAIDAVRRDGTFIQMKTSVKAKIQNDGLQKAKNFTGSENCEVWVPEGRKVSTSPQVKEVKGVTEKRLRKASKAKTLAKGNVGVCVKAGVIGAAVGGGIEGVKQGVKLVKKSKKGEEITRKDYEDAACQVGKEALFGGVSGVAVAGFGLAAGAAAAPGIVVVGGGIVVGAAASFGAKKGFKLIKKHVL